MSADEKGRLPDFIVWAKPKEGSAGAQLWGDKQQTRGGVALRGTLPSGDEYFTIRLHPGIALRWDDGLLLSMMPNPKR